MATATRPAREELLARYIVLDAFDRIALGTCGMLVDVDPLFEADLAGRANLEQLGASSLAGREWLALWPVEDADEDVEARLADAKSHALAGEMMLAFANDPAGCRRLARQLFDRSRSELDKVADRQAANAEQVVTIRERLAEMEKDVD